MVLVSKLVFNRIVGAIVQWHKRPTKTELDGE